MAQRQPSSEPEPHRSRVNQSSGQSPLLRHWRTGEGVVSDLVPGRSSCGVAQEAAANLWSGFGYQDAPGDVLRMFAQAIEIGYLTALRDVRNGDLDDHLGE